MSNKTYWQKTKGTKNFMKIVWKRLEVMIRFATEEDAEELLRIYSYYVENTAITFEYDTPALDEFKYRIRTIKAMYPYLVSEVDGKIVGYAYANTFKDRAAYDWAVETTIYLDKDARGKGYGKELYEALEKVLKAQNITNLYACIGYPEVEDQYLTKNSVQYHEHLGYRFIGTFKKCGYKFNRWYDMVWMEKMIGEHSKNQKEVILFREIGLQKIENSLIGGEGGSNPLLF